MLSSGINRLNAYLILRHNFDNLLGSVAHWLQIYISDSKSRDPAWFHTFMENDHEIISKVILGFLLIQAFCQYVYEVLVNHFVRLAQEKSLVSLVSKLP